MQIKIVKTVAVGTIVTLGAYATTTNQTATPHLAVLNAPIVQVPVRKAA
jgi:hypothetical protein